MNNSQIYVAKKLNINVKQVKVVLDLLKEGSTVPFIARYRQSATGGLNEEAVEKIHIDYQYSIELNKRKEAILKLLEEKGLLTSEVKNAINNATRKSKLESIYEPFKTGKKTKASEAIKLGLEPLSKQIFTSKDILFDPLIEAKKYISGAIVSVEFAIEQSKYIIAQWMSQDLKVRKIIKDQIKNFGFIVSKKKTNAKDEKQKFKQYYEYKELIKKIPNHRILSLNRGEIRKVLNVDIDYTLVKIMHHLNQHFFKINATKEIMLASFEDALKRLIIPSIKREIRKDLFERAEEASIQLFASNLEEMLLLPSVKGKTILAIDPAFVSGCKIAILSSEGQLLKIDLFKPTPPHNKISQSKLKLGKLIAEYNVDIIVIGNGTASRETESFVAKSLQELKQKIPFAIVSEVGASVYSALPIAIKEFPDLSVEQRSAINIGRRFQDPLNELVKIDPKAIGIGQYQHDVNQKELSQALNFKVNKVVNMVGVDINSATAEILSYIAGISKAIAKNIVEYKKDYGTFKKRKEIMKVKGLGSKAYEQAIGFLRIHDSSEFYDRTNIHPESYKLANKIVDYLKLDLKNIDKNLLKNVDEKNLAKELDSNEFDVRLILDALIAPGKDIRDSRDGPILHTGILKITDLKKGAKLEGTVQNITDFGAFVYIGLKQAALIHVSQMSDKYISHPSELLKVGQKVTIKIINVELERERIQAKLIS